MRYSLKGEVANNPENQLFGVDFHDFMQQAQTSTNMELAQEFDMTLRSVKSIKKKLERN